MKLRDVPTGALRQALARFERLPEPVVSKADERTSTATFQLGERAVAFGDTSLVATVEEIRAELVRRADA